MNNYKLSGALSLLGLLLCANNAQSEESLWLFAKGSDTRPQGSFEIKASDLLRTGKTSANYDFHDLRLEAEYGLTSSLTISTQVKVFRHDYEVFNEDLKPYIETQGGLGSRFKGTEFGGYELGLKYNVLSPYKDAFGLSFGLGYEKRERNRFDGSELSQDAISLGAFMQKTYLDDSIIMALSPKIQHQRNSTGGGLQEELTLDVSAGITYRVNPGWFAGLEFRHQSGYLNPYQDGRFNTEMKTTNVSLSDFKFNVGSQYQRGNYAGPTVHYATQSWWATLGALYQFEGQGIAPSTNNSNNRNSSEQERWNIGLILGWEFGRDNGNNEFEFEFDDLTF